MIITLSLIIMAIAITFGSISLLFVDLLDRMYCRTFSSEGKRMIITLSLIIMAVAIAFVGIALILVDLVDRM